jgi:RES domain-containing protein
MGNKLSQITLWRLDRDKYVNEDCCLNGVGASKSSGRWNRQQEAVVYTSANISLAFLEVYIHLDLHNSTPKNIIEHSSRRIVQIYLDDLDYEEVKIDRLPDRWREIITSTNPKKPTLLQRIGSKWLRAKITPVLKVPSAVVPYEYNYLINPNHPDIIERLSLQNPVSNLKYKGTISTTALPELFQFDSRYIQNYTRYIQLM